MDQPRCGRWQAFGSVVLVLARPVIQSDDRNRETAGIEAGISGGIDPLKLHTGLKHVLFHSRECVLGGRQKAFAFALAFIFLAECGITRRARIGQQECVLAQSALAFVLRTQAKR
eukprot:scaffold54971_cov47-Attheya_sp.AAC.3